MIHHIPAVSRLSGVVNLQSLFDGTRDRLLEENMLTMLERLNSELGVGSDGSGNHDRVYSVPIWLLKKLSSEVGGKESRLGHMIGISGRPERRVNDPFEHLLV